MIDGSDQSQTDNLLAHQTRLTTSDRKIRAGRSGSDLNSERLREQAFNIFKNSDSGAVAKTIAWQANDERNG